MNIYREFGQGHRGTNQITKPFNQTGDVLRVHSIFPTIQGEGPFAGWPAVFIRLSRCNLSCTFCDTFFEDGEDKAVKEIIEKVLSLSVGRFVVITGGEPLIQNICPLVAELDNHDYVVQVETSGSVIPNKPKFIYWFGLQRDRGHTIVCSPKTPKIRPEFYELNIHWKYLIREGEISPLDGLPIKSTQVEGKDSILARPWTHYEVGLLGVDCRLREQIFVHPCEEADPEKTRRNAELAAQIAMKYGYRFGLQLHKIVGLP